MEGSSPGDSDPLCSADRAVPRLGLLHCSAPQHNSGYSREETARQTRNREEVKTLKELRNADQCITLEESQESLKDWLCTSAT